MKTRNFKYYNILLKYILISCFLICKLDIHAQNLIKLNKSNIYKDSVYGDITSYDISKDIRFFCYGTSEGSLYLGKDGAKNKLIFNFYKPIQNLRILNNSVIAIVFENFDSTEILLFNLTQKKEINSIKIKNPNYYCEINKVNENLLILLSENLKCIYDFKLNRVIHKFNLPKNTFWKSFKQGNQILFFADKNDTAYSCSILDYKIIKSKLKTCPDYKIKSSNNVVLFDYCDSEVNLISYSEETFKIIPFYPNKPEIAYINQLRNNNIFFILFKDYTFILYNFKEKKTIKTSKIVFPKDVQNNLQFMSDDSIPDGSVENCGIANVVRSSNGLFIFDRLNFILYLSSKDLGIKGW